MVAPKAMIFFRHRFVALHRNTKKWPPAFLAPIPPFCKAIIEGNSSWRYERRY